MMGKMHKTQTDPPRRTDPRKAKLARALKRNMARRKEIGERGQKAESAMSQRHALHANTAREARRTPLHVQENAQGVSRK
jgi:hypothetical protein